VSGKIAGCGALKEHDGTLGKIKAMRTSVHFLRRGVAALLLDEILAEAQRRGYQEVGLETGTIGAFTAARNLYHKFGFTKCGPFADYVKEPNSVCMSKILCFEKVTEKRRISDFFYVNQ
jgi:putative acetyltransferase